MTRLLVLELAVGLMAGVAGGAGLEIRAVNPLDTARSAETLELPRSLLAPLGEKDLRRIHVKDAAGKEYLCQAIDTDGDDAPDLVIFQSDFAPSETRQFTVFTGSKWIYTKEQFRAHGRFVRERCDDFAWENDRIAHRMYGRALETWGPEPLTSSAVDVWSKRTSRLVIEDWYLLDNYHSDAGEGADFYSAGTTRGLGGTGLWADGRLWVSRNFVQSRVLANGPIRVEFELTYEPFDVNGISVAETKRIRLDAGRNLDHFESRFEAFVRPGQTVPLTCAIGVRKANLEQKELNAGAGWLAAWERMEKNAGGQGDAVIFDPKNFESQTEDKLNLLVLEKVPADGRVSYDAGFCWDKAGPIKDAAAWKAYVEKTARELAAPVVVTAR
ncbi:MAG: DUF4861 family protein [Verrucomicrobiota bacterium]